MESTAHVEIIPAYTFPKEIEELFLEYTQMLVKGDAAFAKYLEIQNYNEELQHLEAKYGMPAGRLHLARYGGKTAGCIGLRKIDEHRCEMKRLYVKPEFQGKAIGRRLIEQVIADAKEIGYSCMLLDTLPFLQSALYLYRQYGFYEVESYNNSPMDTSIYMRLDLSC